MTSDATPRIASITVDCRDADELATFWAAYLGLAEAYASEDRRTIALAHGDSFLSFTADEGYRPPAWPDGDQGQQVHLDVYVPDLDAGVARAVALGARLADPQPNPGAWRVLLDPAGHPFCLMLPFD